MIGRYCVVAAPTLLDAYVYLSIVKRYHRRGVANRTYHKKSSKEKWISPVLRLRRYLYLASPNRL